MKKIILVNILVAACFSACNNKPVFTVKGDIQGAEGDTLFLERRNFNDVQTLDSFVFGKDGGFQFKSPAPEYPDLYILRLNGQVINLSVDSIETITVNADKVNFASGYTVEDSESSAKLKDVVLLQNGLQNDLSQLKSDYRLRKIDLAGYNERTEELISTYKETVRAIIISDPKSPTAYFALFQRVDGVLIFNPYERADSRMFSAVATAWNHYYSGTPRAAYLREFTLSAIRERRDIEQKSSMISEALSKDAVGTYYNINLPDIYGKAVSLHDLKGKAVLLDFTVYAAEYSPLHNINLNALYEKYKDKLEIYQVSFDPDENFWKNAAANLPWITVRDDKSELSELLPQFNIQQLPTVFLLNAEGELVQRVDISADFEKEVKKVL